MDYPVYGKVVAHAVASGECEKGIVICSTGIGIPIAANKIPSIHCALYRDCFSAKGTRLHNNENVLDPGALFTGMGLDIVDLFIDTPFSGEECHCYICYMGANHRNNCNGQRSYVAKRVEDIVLQATRLLLDTIKDTPRDESVEARVQAEMKDLKYELRKTQQQVEEAAKEQEGLEMEVSRCLLGKSNFTTAMLSRLIDDKARERRELENKALDLERRVKNETEMSEKVAEYYNRFLGWSMEFGLATIERKRIIISQLYKRIELGRGYVVNFEVDWNYKQFIDTLELEQHMGITEVGIPMPPKVRKRSTQNSNRKNNGAA